MFGDTGYKLGIFSDRSQSVIDIRLFFLQGVESGVGEKFYTFIHSQILEA